MKYGTLPFGAADILLPREGYERWACVACDQFTSEPAYWEEAARIAGDAPSALKLILPEVWLGSDESARIDAVNAEMNSYLADGIFTEYPSSMIFVERTLPDGAVRFGIVGAADLAAYDYNAGSESPVRATEGTVLSRIPPRVAIRERAPLELPHIMLLCDDRHDTVFSCLKNADLRVLYDFDLMMGGGHIRGSLIDAEHQAEVLRALGGLADGTPEGGVLIAVGDGNHSLASAKECFRANPTPRNRFALAELVNIHDPALVFEPIYRVVFGCDPTELIKAAEAEIEPGDKSVHWLSAAGAGSFTLGGLVCDTLQDFIDRYCSAHPGASCDYVHGEDSARALGCGENAVAFLFDGMDKAELFPYVAEKGALPRKTFSMGEAQSKRYYIEARRIDPRI